MGWDADEREGLEVALNEAEVVGMRVAAGDLSVDLLLHVLSLPAEGPMDSDVRRILRLRPASEVRVLLRGDTVDLPARDNPAIPFADLAAVEGFFAQLSWSGSIYGWRFIDDPTLTSDWPDQPSLTVTLSPSRSAHTFYWFNECGHGPEGQTRSYVIEGTVAFDELEILSADGEVIHLPDFIADGVRYWSAVSTRDDRLRRVDQAHTTTWRNW